jgi:hypothetical protein
LPTRSSTRSIPHTTGSGIRGADVRTMAIWLAVGIVLMVRFLRQPLGEK